MLYKQYRMKERRSWKVRSSWKIKGGEGNDERETNFLWQALLWSNTLQNTVSSLVYACGLVPVSCKAGMTLTLWHPLSFKLSEEPLTENECAINFLSSNSMPISLKEANFRVTKRSQDSSIAIL